MTTDDRLAIYELIALHGHLIDTGGFGRLHDVQALGFGLLKGAQALTEAFRTLGDGNPLGHHEDLVRRTSGRWRIAYRTVISRQTAVASATATNRPSEPPGKHVIPSNDEHHANASRDNSSIYRVPEATTRPRGLREMRARERRDV